MRRPRRGTAAGSRVPAGLAMAGVVFMAVVAAGFFVAAPVTWLQAREMKTASVCEPVGDVNRSGCLVQIAGSLDGPHYARGPGEDWFFQPRERAPITRGSDVEVGTVGTRRLQQLHHVNGLYWNAKLVAFRDSETGEIVETVEFGDQGWLRMLFFGLGTAAAVLIYGDVALRKRKVSRGWWATGPKVFLSDIPRSRRLRAGVLFAPGCIGSLLIYLSFAPQVAAIAALIIGAAFLALVLWGPSEETQ